MAAAKQSNNINSNFVVVDSTTECESIASRTMSTTNNAINQDSEINRSYSSFSDISIDYAPSPNTCAFALARANQAKIQTLLRQVMEQNGHDRLDTLRLLRKSLKEVDYHLAWLSQLDFFETIDKILQDVNWRVVNDCTLLLIDAIPRLQFDIEPTTITQMFSHIIPNLGHKQSDVRRSTLLLLNMYIVEHPNHFQHTLKLLIQFGFSNHHNLNAQKGCILSLPLLLTDKVVHNQDLMPLMACLSDLLVNSDTHLFFPLFLAMQRLHNIIGDRRFKFYMKNCHPEATILYNQAASRSNSVSSVIEINNSTTTTGQSTSGNVHKGSSLTHQNAIEMPIATEHATKRLSISRNNDHTTKHPEEVATNISVSPTRRSSIKQINHGDNNAEKETRGTLLNTPHNNKNVSTSAIQTNQYQKNVTFDKRGNETTSTNSEREDGTIQRRHSTTEYNTNKFTEGQQPVETASHNKEERQQLESTNKQTSCVSPQSSISSISTETSALSSQSLVDPARYMNISPSINPTVPIQFYDRAISNRPIAPAEPPSNELKFGIFPRNLILTALSNKYPDKLESLQQMMIIMRESPINHLAILMTYFDSFLDQFLARLMNYGDYHVELIAIDMIETIVVKTKVSTMAYIRPMVNLLIRGLGDQRAIFRENTIRVFHKIMTFLPPQQVIDAMFEHKHSKSANIREESINRITAAVLIFDKSEFNLTKLCYHVIPMLADQHRNVRLAALECLAVLAYALGPERIGSLLTAAEAVQTGCDYDGLLDAIHARLCRRALPRCEPDGSIRYVIKPLMSATGSGRNRENADINWILQAPSYQSKYSHPNILHLRPSPTGSEMCHESSCQSSKGDLYEDHIESNIPGLRKNSLRRSDPNLSSEHHQVHDSFINSPELAPVVNDTSDVESKEKREDSTHCNNTSLQHQTSYPFYIKQSNRSNSQGSTSSVSTSKELFRYYLQKFKQSLVEDTYQQINSVTLPSDSIIYTDSPIIFNETTELASKFQQTSFDYDNEEEVGTIPAPCHLWQHKDCPSSDVRHKMNTRKEDSTEKESMASSSRSTTPISVMEKKNLIEKEARKDQKVREAPSRSGSTSQLSNRKPSLVSNSKISKENIDDDTEKNAMKNIRDHSQGHRRRQSIKNINIQQSQSNETNSENNNSPGEKSATKPNVNEESEREVDYVPDVPKKDPKAKARLQIERQQQELVSLEPNTKEQPDSSADHRSVDNDTCDSDEKKKQKNESQVNEENQSDDIHTSSMLDANLKKEISESDTSDSVRSVCNTLEEKPSSASIDQNVTNKLTDKADSMNENDSISSQSSAKLIKNELELGQEQDQENSDEHSQDMKEYIEHGTQTSGRLRQQDHDTKRRDSRHSRRQSSVHEDHPGARRKASKSQPPPLERNHSRQSLKDTQLTRDDNGPHMVAASSSMTASVNIRHILENVAQTEGPFQEPNIAFKVAMNAIEAPVWSTKVEGMLALIRLATFHQPLIVKNLHDVICRTANETKNLRSTVARSAIFALGDYCVKLKRQIEPEMDAIVQALLAKSVENTSFIRDDIRKAFVCMVEELTSWRLALSLIHHGSFHKNLHIRQMASQFISLLVEKMGSTKCMVGSKDISDQLIPAAARFTMDNSPHTRFYGRKIFSVLMNHNSFERLMRKHCTPSMYRNTLGIIESIKRRGLGVSPL